MTLRQHEAFEDLCVLADLAGLHVALLASDYLLRTAAGDEYRAIDVLAVLPPGSTDPVVGCRLGDGLDGQNLNDAARRLIDPLRRHIVQQQQEGSR